jgi:hypothetical protein
MSALSRSTSSSPGACPLIKEVSRASGAKPRIMIDLKNQRLRNLKHTIRTTARLFCECITGQEYRCVFLTLTYRDDGMWRPYHITKWVKCVRSWLSRRGHPFMYVWVAELTEIGRVHYHVVIWLPKSVYLPHSDTRGWWPHGMTRTETARRPIGYIMKYVSKGTNDANFKKGLRMVGTGGLSVAQRLERAWWKLPRWLRDESEPKDRIVKAKGGGWVSRLTGRIWTSFWRFIGVGPPFGDDRNRYAVLESVDAELGFQLA